MQVNHSPSFSCDSMLDKQVSDESRGSMWVSCVACDDSCDPCDTCDETHADTYLRTHMHR